MEKDKTQRKVRVGCKLYSSLGEGLLGAMEQAQKEREIRAMERYAEAVENLVRLQESEQAAIEPQKEKEIKDLLPAHLKNDEAVKIFNKAIEDRIIEKTETGFKSLVTKALLAYFLGHFLLDGTFPDKIYCRLFNEHKLSQAYYRLADNKLGNGKPREYEKIDILFEE